MFKTIIPLSFIVASRFFGLFIVLPVISLYALELKGANEFYAGVLIGIYAITQMIFQVPFGAISDKFGRKKTMLLGLIIFVIGSLICAVATDIFTMLFGRALQGVAAIGAVGSAMICDFSKEEERSKAMAVLGSMIGLSFATAMIFGSVLASKFGLASLFYLSVGIGILSIVLLYTIIGKEPKIYKVKHTSVDIKALLYDKDLFIMNFTNFMQKMLINIAFISIPIILVRFLGYSENNLWKIYTTGAILGLVATAAAGFFGDAKGKTKQILVYGVIFFIISYMIFALSMSTKSFIIAIMVFFIGFNIHEPIMQSCVSKFAKADQKGVVLGIFNSSGFLGSFMGGVVGGVFLQYFSMQILAILVVIISCVWLIMLINLSDPAKFKNIYLPSDTKGDFDALLSFNGIIEIYTKDQNIVIKYNCSCISENEIYARLKV